jgi:two-component system, OmpR family, alkaline phosphatase synthesis response regulator PhoP
VAKSKILLVEDEDNLAIGLVFNLEEEGYAVMRAKDGREAMKIFEANHFDLAILDVMLPYYDGFELTQKMRLISSQIPIIILSAKIGAKNRIKGLKLGADDYMVKPFHIQELLERIKGMLKRKQWYEKESLNQSVYVLNNNEINFDNLLCRSERNEFQLTNQEALVLKYLIQHKGKIVTRAELLKNVWNVSAEMETRTVDNFIARLRKYFEPNPSKPVFIKSIRGAGYIFTDYSGV